MLAVFLFNIGGYYLALLALEYKSNQLLAIRIDRNQYEETETITIKIPLALPYPIQQHGYERVEGNFEYAGQYYKIVKQKLEDDVLYIVCIKNDDQKRVNDTINDYVKLSNDLPGTAKKALSFFSKLLKDFNQGESAKQVQTSSWSIALTFPDDSKSVESLARNILSPPPKV
jgi:hypothetical protein